MSTPVFLFGQQHQAAAASTSLTGQNNNDINSSNCCDCQGFSATAAAAAALSESTSATTATTTNPNHKKRSNNNDDEMIMVQELNAMSVQERQNVLEQVHGVHDIPEEKPDVVAKCMEQLAEALKELPRTRRTAYDRAVFLKPSIEDDTKFKLMFLRGYDYDPGKAARRIAKYFEDKLELFGDAKLVKPITLDDLNEEDMAVMNTGVFVVLPYKDRSGRPISFNDISKFDFDHGISMIRCCWYQIMCTLEDEVAQLKGVSSILYCLKPMTNIQNVSLPQFYEVFSKAGKLLDSLPVRITSSHFCYNNIATDFVLSAFRKSFGKDFRHRVRTHFGSAIEVQYSLMTYGITCPLLLNKNGTDEMIELLQSHHERRQVQETQDYQKQQQEESKTGIILYPQPKDILVGRGRPYQTYSGNQILNTTIDNDYLESFCQKHGIITSSGDITGGSTGERFGKSCVYMDVVNKVQSVHGCRFLERTKQGWKIVNETVARKKVGSAFRSKLMALSSSSTSTTTNNNNNINNGITLTNAAAGIINNNNTSNTFNIIPGIDPTIGNNNNNNNNNNNMPIMMMNMFQNPFKRVRYDPSNAIAIQQQQQHFRNHQQQQQQMNTNTNNTNNNFGNPAWRF